MKLLSRAIIFLDEEVWPIVRPFVYVILFISLLAVIMR